MASINKVILVGNLGRDPEIRANRDGSKMALLSVATSDYWKDKETSEMKSITEWHRIVVFVHHLAEIMEKSARKGQMVYVEGSLRTRKWTDKNNVEQRTTEVVVQRYDGRAVMLNRSENAGAGAGHQNPFYDQGAGAGHQDPFYDQGAGAGNHFSSSNEGLMGREDEIPF